MLPCPPMTAPTQDVRAPKKVYFVSDINFAIWRRFKENGVSIPFPQREVRILNEVVPPAASA